MKNELVIIIWGKIGDILVSSAAIRALKETHPDKQLILYCSSEAQRDVFRNNPYVHSIRIFRIWNLLKHPYHLYVYLFDRKRIKYYRTYFQYIPLTWIYEKSVKDIVPETFGDLNVVQRQSDVQLFFTKEEENRARERLAPFRNVIFMHIFSGSSVNHHWPLNRWEKLVASMPGCTFIQLGNKSEPQVAGTIDWRGQTSLREALCLIKYGSSFVGVDSCFSHATNAFNLPGVVLFGDSSPIYWGHSNNINIYKAVRCSPCYYHLAPAACPYDHACMNLIEVEEVRLALLRQLEVSRNI
jgi:ADP-heptose:LPS heptosyltransferase